MTRGTLRIAAAAIAGLLARRAAAQDTVPPHDTFTLRSAALDETRRINVYLPPGYGAGNARFAVLYMPDGGVEEDFPHVAATVDAAIRAGEMRPVLVVGIENTQRRRDMTGPTSVASDSAIAPRVGGSAAFRRFIASELMPEVRRRYRTTGETAILGESLAGLFIVETFLLQPELFDTYIALSPSLWWNRGALVDAAAGHLRAHRRMHAALYLASAADDILPPIERFAGVLRASAPRGLRWSYVPRPDLRHATIYRGSEPRVLREMLPPRAARPPLIAKVEHVYATTPDAQRLFELFRDSLGLPVVWRFRDYGEFASGGVSLGNVVLELATWRPGPGEVLPTGFGAMALEPGAHTADALAALDRRGIAHGAPDSSVTVDSAGRAHGWVNTWLTGLLPDSVAFLCDYLDRARVAAGRRAAADSLVRSGGGPLGVTGVWAIDVGVRDLPAARRAWRRLLEKGRTTWRAASSSTVGPRSSSRARIRRASWTSSCTCAQSGRRAPSWRAGGCWSPATSPRSRAPPSAGWESTWSSRRTDLASWT